MDTITFNKFLEYGEIVNVNYPLQGAVSFYNYGHELLKNIVTLFLDDFKRIGYKEAELPQIVPYSFISHLNKNDLFKVEYFSDVFYLAGSAEMQSSLIANSLVRTYKDLPVKIVSCSYAYRKSKAQPLIKGVEHKSYELNSFFEKPEEINKDITAINHLFEKNLKKLGIDFIRLRQDKNKGPFIVYSYFPFSDTFASLFWIDNLGTQYIERVSKGYIAKDGTIKMPFHLNAGFTSRILAAYLASHIDEKGFIIGPDIAPFKVFIPKLGYNNEVNNILKEVKKNGLKYTVQNIEKRNIAFEKFFCMGIPLMIAPGEKEIQICFRDKKPVWIKKSQLGAVLKKVNIRKKKNKTINILQATEIPKKEIPGMIYKVTENCQDAFIQGNYKKLGYFDDENIAFVKRKY